MYGRSTYISPLPAGFVAAAEFYDFAPMTCVCCQCLVGEDQRKRTYAHVYENRLEVNIPAAPFCCFTRELCMRDCVTVSYFDKPPARSGLAPPPCCCVPLTCCGPPVIYVASPKFCCLDMKTCYGQRIMAAPCNLFNLKCCLCCGNPCYTNCAWPIIPAVANGEKFLSAMKYAVGQYARRVDLPETQVAQFAAVEDNIFDFGKAKGLQELKMSRQ